MKNNEKGVPFGVFCSDGFEPQLTLCTIRNSEGEQRTALLGKGSRLDLVSVLTGSIRAVCETGLNSVEMVAAFLTAANEAKLPIDELMLAINAVIRDPENFKKLYNSHL